MIKKELRLADVIHQNYHILPVLNRFGIHLGFGNTTVSQICEANNINTDFFLDILNTFNDPEYFPKKHLQSFSIKMIVEYLSETHKYYTEYLIPEIENKINSLVSAFPNQEKQLVLLKQFFIDYKKELFLHIEKEDQGVFPFVMEIEKAYNQAEIDSELILKLEHYSIKNYMEEHDDIEEKLMDLKNLIIKYIPQVHNDNLSNSILMDLFDLEKDMNNHARIEDKVMIPKVLEYELTIRERIGNE